MKIKFNIVGLTHGAKQQDTMGYAHQAKGKHLALVMDNQNDMDPIAVAVKDGRESIGYVAAQDCEKVRAAFVATGRKMLFATCQGWGTKDGSEQGLYLPAEVSFEPKMPIEQALAQIYDDSAFTSWEYSGPTYCISQLSDIDSNTDMLEELLTDVLHEKHGRKQQDDEHLNGMQQGEKHPDALPEELEPMLEDVLADFLKNHAFDYSREMRRTRRRICELLSEIVGETAEETSANSASSEGSASVSFLEQGLHALLADMGFITSSRYRDRAARCFFIETPGKMLRMSTGTYDYSDRLDEIEHELEAFPDHLYSYFKTDPVDFLRRVFYRRVPRKQMLQLLSGLILLVINGRVGDVTRWGKHGDQESLEAMKSLGNHKSLDATVREGVVDACIVKIFKVTIKGGYIPIIKYQSDWYPIYRLLQEIGEYGSHEEGRFCKRIESLKEKNQLKGKSCKQKDLTQAACDIFESKNASEWHSLTQEELKDMKESKFNHYCDIIAKFQSLLNEECGKRHLQYEVIFSHE